jgi:anti-anti-sigma factor
VLWTDQRAVVVLPGRIDLSNSGEIRGELLSVINRGATTLIADLSATVSCDHSGTEAVARAYQRAVISGTDLRLVITRETVRRTFSISGIDWLVSVYPSLDTALAASTPAEQALTPVPGRPAGAGAGEGRQPGGAGAGGRQPGGIRPAGPQSAGPQSAGPQSAGPQSAGPQSAGPGPAAEAEPAPGPSTEIALLDQDGVIVSVNPAWQAFAEANQAEMSRVGPGVSYLEVCAEAGDDPVALEVAGAIKQALAGDLPGPLAIEVPCHSPYTSRWFDMLISARVDDAGEYQGATVTLSLAKSEARVTPAPAADEGESLQFLVQQAEDRDRIAQGVNDLLVTRLFSAGLSLHTALGILGEHPAAGRIWDAVNELDLTIRDLRTILFNQQPPDRRSG